MKFSLLPKEKKFFAYFEQQADNLVKMARQLHDMLNNWQYIKEKTSLLADMERDGDAITHDIMSLLHRTFITPFDREDISALAYALDDIANRIHGVADILYLYNIEGPTDQARELGEILLKAVLEVECGVSVLNTGIYKVELLQRCKNINELENSGDSIYRGALAELFTRTDDIAFIVKWREIYNKLESAIDACEQLANVMEGFALKYT
jgi:predicted phosphate transport protein (TIGR00153 family)